MQFHHLPQLRLEKATLADDVRTLLQTAKPEWPRDEQPQLEPLSGGFSCLMYRCFLASKRQDALTVRVWYQLEQSALATHDFEMKVLQEANKHGYCSKLVAVFANGYCYEYVEGEPIFSQSRPECRLDQDIIRGVARRMADIHSLRPDGVDSVEISFFRKLEQMLADTYKQTLSTCPSRDAFLREVKLVEQFTTNTVTSPVVVVHGDAHPGNIVWNKNKLEITFVDWELAQVMYGTYDMGYFLYILQLFEQCFQVPVIRPKDIERSFCKFYLEKQLENSGRSADEATEANVTKLQSELAATKLAVALFFVVCNVTLSDLLEAGGVDPKVHFNFVFELYLETREKLLGSSKFGEN